MISMQIITIRVIRVLFWLKRGTRMARIKRIITDNIHVSHDHPSDPCSILAKKKNMDGGDKADYHG
jgi:hypothetical protein